MAEGASRPPEAAEPTRPATTILTIGHSTRSSEELIDLLREHRVDLLVDVRRYPGSRRYPHFGAGPLADALGEAGIAYLHEEALGGRRGSAADSPNGGIRNASLRAYADHMDSPEFGEAVERLLRAGEAGTPVVMCAEAVPWRCHRWFLADALLARGAEVRHILGPGEARPHELNPAARVSAGRVRYPPPEPRQRSLFPDS